MSEPSAINPRIVEALYCEAIVLADEVRHAFTLSGRLETASTDEDLARVALSSEGLRTTTRMMHAIAWLLNHRAHFMGEINELQLHRHGRLPPDSRVGDAGQTALLEPAIIELVETTRRFYDRLVRLDQSWRARDFARPTALERMRENLEQRLAC